MDQHGLDLLKVLKYKDPISLFNFFMSGKRETYLTTPYHDNQFVYKASIIWNEKVFKSKRHASALNLNNLKVTYLTPKMQLI